METENTDKIEYWQKHIAAAESHPKGLTAYFKEQNVNSSSFYLWRHRIKGQGQKPISKPAKRTARKQISSFLPISVAEVMPKYPEPQQTCAGLPDAKWLAEVILAVHARCR